MFTELEYKYDATDIALSDFDAHMHQIKDWRDPFCFKKVSGTDCFFSHKDHPKAFHRVRTDKNGRCEMTLKVKTTESNNVNRIEIDIPLDRWGCEIGNQYLKTLGWEYDFILHKTSNIYEFNDLVFAYYTVLGPQTRSFVEVEVRKDRLDFMDSPMLELDAGEALLAPLGITKASRLNQSLYEIYRPEVINVPTIRRNGTGSPGNTADSFAMVK